MFTTGSKLIIGSALAATVAAVIYGLTLEGAMGTVGLVAAAVALWFLAGVNAVVRDANVLQTDDASVNASAAAHYRPVTDLINIFGAVGCSNFSTDIEHGCDDAQNPALLEVIEIIDDLRNGGFQQGLDSGDKVHDIFQLVQ